METLISVQRGLKSLQSEVARLEVLRKSALDRLSETEVRITFLEGESATLNRVADLFRILIDQEVIDNAKTAEALLTEGLQAIFDDLNLSVRSDVTVERGKVSVDLFTVQKEINGTSSEGMATDAFGGSVATVQSVLLRVVVLSRRGLKPLILLDESLGAVAERYVPRVGQFLALLAQRLDLDILAVSHNPVMVEAAHHSYRIQKKDGAATFKKIREGSKA